MSEHPKFEVGDRVRHIRVGDEGLILVADPDVLGQVVYRQTHHRTGHESDPVYWACPADDLAVVVAK